jgi:hypothetical protein
MRLDSHLDDEGRFAGPKIVLHKVLDAEGREEEDTGTTDYLILSKGLDVQETVSE